MKELIQKTNAIQKTKPQHTLKFVKSVEVNFMNFSVNKENGTK